MKDLQHVLPDLEKSVFHCEWTYLQPDPEELCTFTELYGSLRLLLSIQIKDTSLFSPEWCAHTEAFLHTFSLANAGIKIHLKLKLSQQTVQREFRGKVKKRVARGNQPSPVLDVTCRTQPPVCVKKGCWCLGGHPVCGGQIPLSIHPDAMDQGLFGELSIQPVTLLSPCVLQYPHLTTQLTQIKVLVYSPSNVPVTGPSIFFQNLPAHLDCQELGMRSLHCSSFKDLVHSGGFVYTVEQENSEDAEVESNPSPVQQSLLLFLFLQHSDPFTCQLSDIMGTEALIEHHLEDILNNNRQAVTTALQTELKNTLRAQNLRQKASPRNTVNHHRYYHSLVLYVLCFHYLCVFCVACQERKKLGSAAEVILSSSLSIVSCSSNMYFRNACLNCMKVCDTHDLSASLRESLRRVTSWKFVSKGGCYSDRGHDYFEQIEEEEQQQQLESDEPKRTEI
ncbi:DUF4554 domain-containing protein [Labrus mixtus]|uniref:DUF4554 domain-containing protein n=1 Tax=Labrus mixtus TaxID=508554 RepID=UPI0029C0728A|nr:DUF4554 domain-containing protein [Labrus mixtus]